ncbi:DinB family protein [Pedobacter sp.]|uniref:DinB family protein n=1 Tax=Pedobacter sp. TaxID=1411316 RepID=UPI003D7F8014
MMNNNHINTVINELSYLIKEGNAHVSFEEAVKDIPVEQLSVTPEGLPYNLWQLAEHIRITQWDILEFCINPDHQSPKWPEGYWVSQLDKPDQQQWHNCITQVIKDRDRFIQLLNDPGIDLFTPLPEGTGQNIFREAVLIADHTSYHTGQIIVLRRLLHNWD